MNKKTKKMRDAIRENPDLQYIGVEETLYYCHTCLSTKVQIAITGKVYCGECDKYLDILENIIKEVC